MPEKISKWVAIIGKKNNGLSVTKSIKGRARAAPPKPKPARTKPDQTKIPLMTRICVLLKSIRY